MAEIVGKQLHINGFIYYKNNSVRGKTYWICKRGKQDKECKATATTTGEGEGLRVLRGEDASAHTHPPDREEAGAAKVVKNLKRIAADHPGMPPAQILRVELPSVSSGILSQLPDRENLKKMLRWERRKDLPKNPQNLQELGEIPEIFTKTLLGEQFLLCYSRDEDDEDEEDEDDRRDRILVFATRRNLELLAKSPNWFIDGTFQECPGIFVQVFTVSGLVSRVKANGDEEYASFPLVYALLPSKLQVHYTKVFDAIKAAAANLRIEPFRPERSMSDFEKGILNSLTQAFPEADVQCCFFHLGQSMYRKVQELGLQVQYNNPDNREVKVGTHRLLSLAFVPPEDVAEVLRELQPTLDAALKPVVKYFKETYVTGKTVRGRRRPNPPRYPVKLWNQYHSTVAGQHRTNNLAEGWHNRFRLVIGKAHPDLFSFLRELQWEQADTEAQLAEFSMGKRIRATPKPNWVQQNMRIETIVRHYDSYKKRNEHVEYLRALAHTIVL